MTLQEFIHLLEEGAGRRKLRNILIALAVGTLLLLYNWRCYRNMTTQEAMDAAQVARNVEQGRGFTTLFIRPLSMHLMQDRSAELYGPVPHEPHTDYAQVEGMHPDLANPPVYPLVLAAWMKTYQVSFKIFNGITHVLPGSISRRLPLWNEDPSNPLWESNGFYWWWPGDFCIAVLNEGLYFAVVVLSFFLARRLFDNNVAWLTVVLLAGMELLWRFSVSGLPTMFLMVVLVALAWCFVFLEQELREPKWSPNALLLLPAAIGLLIGVATMTRYSLACLLIPALLFVYWYATQRQVAICLIMAAAFLLVSAPWIMRNVSVCGMPFGTAGYALIDGTYPYPDHALERSLKPDFDINPVKLAGHKFTTNARDILQSDLPRVGGSWVMPFFLVGLMLGFRSAALMRLRNFIVTSLITFAAVEALGRTGLSIDSPDINSENLLVLLTPLVVIFGVSLFYVILNQTKLRGPNTRTLAIGALGAVTWLPLVGAIFPPRVPPVAYPPYATRAISAVSGWMTERELMMSDIPWAVAWYGDRQCVWLSLNCREDFFAINDFIKPVRGLYLTPETLNGRFLSQWVRPGERSWGSFVLQGITQKQISPHFPLRAAAPGFMPEQLFLTDWPRWTAGSVTNSTAATR